MIRPEGLRLPACFSLTNFAKSDMPSLVNSALVSEFHEPFFLMRTTPSTRNSQLCCPQSRCICDHRDGTEADGSRRDHRIQGQSEGEEPPGTPGLDSDFWYSTNPNRGRFQPLVPSPESLSLLIPFRISAGPSTLFRITHKS